MIEQGSLSLLAYSAAFRYILNEVYIFCVSEWQVAAQVMFAIGIGILFLAFLVALGNLVFKCCRPLTQLPLSIGITILIASKVLLVNNNVADIYGKTRMQPTLFHIINVFILFIY